jgi:hypothetical protein
MSQVNGVTTEWFDQQVKHGNYLPNEVKETNDEIENIVREVIENYDPMSKKTLNELEELEDDFEDDHFIRNLKNKRLQEMKEEAKNSKFGLLREIRYENYKVEVNESSHSNFVVIILHQDYVENSNILCEILKNLAKKHPQVKFLKIQATNCVPNFKDIDVPTIFIYQNGEIFKQFLPAPYFFGGNKMTFNKVEWVFSSLGVLKSDQIEDPFEEVEHFNVKKIKKKREDESDSEDSDKPSRWKL